MDSNYYIVISCYLSCKLGILFGDKVWVIMLNVSLYIFFGWVFS